MRPTAPSPLAEFPKKKIRAIFTDIDDTITDHSRITPQTFAALWGLKERGFWLVLVSGRPAGWADCLMRLWPVDAIVFENGAGLMLRRDEKVETLSLAEHSSRAAQVARLEEVFVALKKKVPALKLATDQPYRLFDYALDFCEEPPRLAEKEVDRLLAELAKERDLTAKLSSIHINYWCGTHTKVTACERLLQTEGKRLGITKQEIVYVGDSPNDEPLFEFFEHSVGVANIQKFLPRLKHPPRYVTREPSGAGFQELAALLLS